MSLDTFEQKRSRMLICEAQPAHTVIFTVPKAVFRLSGVSGPRPAGVPHFGQDLSAFANGPLHWWHEVVSDVLEKNRKRFGYPDSNRSSATSYSDARCSRKKSMVRCCANWAAALSYRGVVSLWKP